MDEPESDIYMTIVVGNAPGRQALMPPLAFGRAGYGAH
jgi:hypothetical protein